MCKDLALASADSAYIASVWRYLKKRPFYLLPHINATCTGGIRKVTTLCVYVILCEASVYNTTCRIGKGLSSSIRLRSISVTH